jgi:hypothetical protein
MMKAKILFFALTVCLFSAYAEDETAPSFTLSGIAGGNKPIAGVIPPLQSSITLKGSRGETLDFMFMVKGNGCTDFSASTKDQELPVTFYEMAIITTTAPSFRGAYVGDHFDPLISLAEGRKLCVERKPKWVWGEVAIPKSAKPGSYHTKIASAVGGGTLDLDTTVWKMVIPDKPAVPAYFAVNTYGILLGHYGEYHSGEGDLALAYRKALQDHRIYTLNNYVKIPDITAKDGVEVLNFESAPSQEESINRVSLSGRPLDAYFSIPIDNFDKGEPAAFARYLAALEKTLPSLNRPGKALIGITDEPPKEKFPEVVRMGKLIRQYAPSVRTNLTTPYNDMFKDVVDIFTPVIDQYDEPEWPSPAVYKKFKAQDPRHEVWWYASCLSHGCEALADSGRPDLVLDRPAVSMRVIPWLTMKYDIDAFLYYEVAYAYEHYPKRDPWKSVWDFSGNGDGTLFYPARAGERGFTKHGPAPSIRLKLWREGSYDAEYIKWMKETAEKPDWWSKGFSSIVTNTKTWSHEYSDYQNLHDKIGEFLNTK